MGNTLYMECASGIAGDMTVASLLDLGASEDGLFRTLGELALTGYDAYVEEFMNSSIRTLRFNVDLEDPSHPENPDFTFQGGVMPEDAHTHTHDDGTVHAQSHAHGDHVHRNLYDVLRILDRISDFAVRNLAERIFRIVAEAEAAVHGKKVMDVHFHEVGAVDSIVDIVGAAYCLTDLGIDEIVLDSVTEGHGTVLCAHGELPIPVPAVLAITEKHGLPIRRSSIRGELVTPTGAAILASLYKGNALPASYSVIKTGYASGHRSYEDHTSILRAMLIEPASHRSPAAAPHSDASDIHRDTAGKSDDTYLVKLETNIDDTTGEALGFTMELLFEAGARDVYYMPVFMKKNRPAYLLSVLCDADRVSELEQIIFRHTTTIGIRRTPVERDVLERKIETVDTPYGPADIKICSTGDETFIYPEYESIRRICLNSDLAYSDASELILRSYREDKD